MTFSWLRWRLLIACLAAGLVYPAITIVQALYRASDLGAVSPLAEDYLREATFSSDTLIALAVTTLEIAIVLYAGSLAVLYLRHARRQRDAA